MRPDATAIHRVADHQVVQPRLRDEVEMVQQAVAFRHPKVHALHQHRPWIALAAQSATRLRAALQAPFFTVARDVARLDIRVAGEVEEFVARQHAGEAGTAWRISRGFFCQCSSRNWRGVRPPRASSAQFHARHYREVATIVAHVRPRLQAGGKIAG